MTHSPVLSETPESPATPESAIQPQSDALSDDQPVMGELRLPPQEPPPARWRVSKSVLLLIGGPLAGALLVGLGIFILRPDPATPPAIVTDQPTPAPAVETQPAIEASAVTAEADPDPVAPEPVPFEAEPAPAESEPAPFEPEPREQTNASASAINEILPNVPQSALDTIRGTVRVSVRVTIDNAGSVVDAAAADPGPSRYFERLSVNASKKWTFTPAEEQRTMLVQFNFRREGVTAQAEPDEDLD